VSILLDAGPCLNFLAVGQQNVLIQVAESQKLRLTAPARVNTEIIGMGISERFKSTSVRSTWNKLKSSRRVEILPDELTTRQFTDAVTRISGMPARDRVRSTKSLGEIMVLAHASTGLSPARSGIRNSDARTATLNRQARFICRSIGRRVLETANGS
jgi:hypothetical protein